MVRGQKKKTLTGRGSSSTGQHKGANKSSNPFADENENPAGPPSPTPSKPHPKPQPLVKKVAINANAIIAEDENGEATAAHALITLQNRNCANSPPINRYFRAAAGLPKDTNLDPSSNVEDSEDEEEEDQLADDGEDVDELEDYSDDLGELYAP